MEKTKSDVEHVVIACCTYRRPLSLERTIQSLLQMNYPEKIKTEILITDNDIELSAKEITEKYQENDALIKIFYTSEENTGLANVRNKALKEAIKLNATHLAFVDDDEIVDKDWLINHIDFYNKNPEIFISSGPTYKKFEKNFSKYIINNNLFKKTTSKKNGQIKKSCASGNVFFPLNITEGVCFSVRFNFLGGEDTEFFSQLSAKGYKIGWNDTSINYEIVGDDRANIKWILSRNYHNGYSVSLAKFNKNNKCFKRWVYTCEKLILTTINFLFFPFSILGGKTCCLNMLSLAYKNAGKLVGVIRLYPIDYYQKH